MTISNAVSDAPKEKGGAAETVRPIQEKAMLNVAERPSEGKADTSSFVGFSDFHRAAMWLDEEVKKARKVGVTTQVVELTPALARVLLERNPDNRRIKGGLVEAYRRDIANDRWQFNGEPVIVSDGGFLNDGQHRCTGVVEADKPITVVLVIGPKHSSRMTTDQGGAKTLADFLSMEGKINTTQLGAAVGFIIQREMRGQIWTSGRPTKSECMKFIEDHDDVEHSVAFVQQKGADTYGGRSMLAFCHWAFCHAGEGGERQRRDADEFITSLVKGDNLPTDGPILYCRNRLIRERGRLRTNDRAELIFRTWNAWKRGDKPATLPILGGALPTLVA